MIKTCNKCCSRRPSRPRSSVRSARGTSRFQRSVRAVTSLQPCSYCVSCQREYSKQHYHRNKDLHIKRRARRTTTRRRDLQRYVAEYLAGRSCVDCGESDIIVLEFDHVRGVKSGDISTLIRKSASLSAIQLELSKCDVRCAN